jgi:thiosulfate dehydrogenase [quinone] large subunit
MEETRARTTHIPEPPLAKFIFADTRFAWFWLIVRLYVGWEWLRSGWEKFTSPLWNGAQAGTAVRGFLNGALQKTNTVNPDVSGWYAYFINHVALPHAALFSYLVTYGEILVGVLLILGLLTGIAAFFGTFMNLNYLFAGTVSINPLLGLLGLFLILAWRVAGWYGLDRYVLPKLGTPWQEGTLFSNSKVKKG